MSQKIIDLRCRPAFLHKFFGAEPGSPEHATARWLNRRVGTRGSDTHFEKSLSQEGFLEEVRQAGLSKAVVVGRHTPSQHLPNDTIHQIVHGHEELLGIAGIDPALQGEKQALAEAERAVLAVSRMLREDFLRSLRRKVDAKLDEMGREGRAELHAPEGMAGLAPPQAERRSRDSARINGE